MRNGVTIAAAVIIGLILVKDGTAQKLIQDGATGLKDLASGVKPLTGIA